jgi:hypothetical protein
MNQPSESSISLGAITERADKLEADAEKPVEKPAEGEPKPEEKPAEGQPKPEDKKPEAKPEDKKAPNDPDELRKWNTKVSMELSEVKKQNADIVKQLQGLADVLAKSTKKAVDWRELAKDPAKLQAAIDEQTKQLSDDYAKKSNESEFKYKQRLTQKENQRRFHDTAYPRWAELNPVVIKLAGAGDSRVNFDGDPDAVLDALYKLAESEVAADPNYKAPTPPAASKPNAKYTEEELAAKIADAVKKAVADAAKGLSAEENGAGVGGMGKGAPKGKQSVDKQALHDMPLSDLRAALIKASPQQ